ncbi:CHAT domain-containing protein [Chlorogloea sp. CCALA 695]|uniref:CHAT domain-containing protein n=1 Tax=Chlorogloea sp. CCALA 695 TaxID=2107693 RepID=UPI0011B26230|nr:CHAT domain-containing protein [Chlorogloea sp. CCALA 695]
MAALHDGKQFLVQKYAVSTSLGLGLSTKEPQKKEQKALVFGLTVKVPPFDSLPNVNAETEAVRDILGGNRFLDQKFTLANLEKQIIKQKNPSVLHIATHGKFRGTANSTFLQAYNGRISLQEFENVLLANTKPIDLLTLSACQTAAGDNRSTLGIAGLAARTGVKNVLASLWFVNDADTVPLIENFYSYLRQPGTTKAEALRKAQLSLISRPNSHPARWSSFILVNS